MRIAHVTPYFQPKLGYEERYISKAQKELGCEVCIVTSDRYFPFPHFGDIVQHILGSRKTGTGLFLENGVPVYRLESFFEWGAAVFVKGMKKVLEDFNPDIVHAHHMLYPTNILVVLSKSSVGYKLVVDEHMVIDDFPRAPLKKFAYSMYKRAFFPLLSRKADHFIAMTPAVFLWLKNEFKIDKRFIKLLSLGADTDLFMPKESERVRYRKLLSLVSDDILITYAGKLLPEKDIDIMIRGVAPLIKRDHRIKVLLLGGGGREYVSKILALAKKLGVEKNVILHNFVNREELSKFYNASDIGVWLGLPSITIIEAMSCGLPIVIAKSLQTCHLLAYNNGFSFSRGDPNEFRMCVERLVQDANLRLQMGQNSRKLVEEKLSWNIIAKKTLDIYRGVLNI